MRMWAGWIAGCALLVLVAGTLLGCGGHPSPSAAATLGCPQAALQPQPALRDVAHPPPRSVVACVGTKPITGAQFAREFAIERRQIGSQIGSQGADVVAFDALNDLIGDVDPARTTCAQAVGNGLLCGLIAPSRRDGLPALGAPVGATEMVVDPASDTIYMLGAGELMMIDGRTCNASTTSGCARPRSISLAGMSPSGIAVDPSTETIYLGRTERPAAIDVLDARTCNATTVSGCRRVVAQARLGAGLVPGHSLIDPSTHTLYVRDEQRAISVVGIGACNARDHSGCAKPPARVELGEKLAGSPFTGTIAVSRATGTLYVLGAGDASAWLVDTRACSGLDGSGCSARPAVLKLPGPALTMALDPATGALYFSQVFDKVAVLDGATCNGAVQSGCGRPRILRVREMPYAIALDARTHTAFMASGPRLDGAELLDIRACGPAAGGGCRTPRSTRTGPDPAQAVAIDERTRTVYVANQDRVSLIRADRCNAVTTAGC